MLETITGAFAGGEIIHPWHVFVRLLTAVALGWAVAWIHGRTSRGDATSSFPTTLVLLCVLIAMVTQVIGDNVARAFSLVGALSIVRFRTVVRDTRDTAFVIFSVAVGMAIGAQSIWVALIGLAVVGAAALVMSGRGGASANNEPYILRLRVASGVNREETLSSVLKAHLDAPRLVCLRSVGSGASMEAHYEARLRREESAEELVEALRRIPGVEDVRLERRGFESN